jgi:hypothetical protein
VCVVFWISICGIIFETISLLLPLPWIFHQVSSSKLHAVIFSHWCCSSEPFLDWLSQLPTEEYTVFLEFIGRDGNMKGTPLDVDPVFHKDFIFYGIDPDMRQKLMDELNGSGGDAETAGSKRKRQAKGRTNFEISALAIRSKYSKLGNHFNAGDIISIAKSKYGEFDFVFISFLRTNHDNFFLLLMELNDFKAFQGADIDGKFLILLNAQAGFPFHYPLFSPLPHSFPHPLLFNAHN